MGYYENKSLRKNDLTKFKESVLNTTLSDNDVNLLIEEERGEFLKEYAQYHQLNDEQIERIFAPNEVTPFMIEMAKVLSNLNEKQQIMLLEKRNSFLFASYLMPNWIFDTNRRFKGKAEELYIQIMADTTTNVGVETFIAYVDNNYRRMLTREVLDIVLEYPDSNAIRYMLRRAKLKKEYEGHFIEKAPDRLLKHYLDYHEINQEYAQLILIDRDFQLAQMHLENYGLRPQAQKTFYARRRSQYL